MRVFPPEGSKNLIEIIKTRKINSFFPVFESQLDVIVWGNTCVFCFSFFIGLDRRNQSFRSEVNTVMAWEKKQV